MMVTPSKVWLAIVGSMVVDSSHILFTVSLWFFKEDEARHRRVNYNIIIIPTG